MAKVVILVFTEHSLLVVLCLTKVSVENSYSHMNTHMYIYQLNGIELRNFQLYAFKKLSSKKYMYT